MNTLKQSIAFLIAFFTTQSETQPEKPDPLVIAPPSNSYHTTDDFRQIIIRVLIPHLRKRGIRSFTGSQARKFIECYAELTEEDLLVVQRNKHGFTKNRWRSLLSQALQSVVRLGVLYKVPGKTRTYYIN
jgi:hypothetical protein